MKMYYITIEDEMFGQMSGIFQSKNEEIAINDAKEFYAMANDTYTDCIDIVSVECIGEFIEKTFDECFDLHGREDYSKNDFIGAEYFESIETLTVCTIEGVWIYTEGNEMFFNSRMNAYKSLLK